VNHAVVDPNQAGRISILSGFRKKRVPAVQVTTVEQLDPTVITRRGPAGPTGGGLALRVWITSEDRHDRSNGSHDLKY
jgi:hypothetical protein